MSAPRDPAAETDHLPEDAHGPGAVEDQDHRLPEQDHDPASPEFDEIHRPTRRVSRGGQMIGAAMIGLAEVLQPRPKQEIPIEIETPGEPPNLDRDGIDEVFGERGGRMVAPPMDALKAKARTGRPVKRRR